MIKYKNLYSKEYNNLRSASLANSLALLFGLDTVDNDDTAPELLDLVNCAKRVDKALIYCPLSLAEWVLDSNVTLKNQLCTVAQLEFRCVSDSLGKKEYGLLNMLTGKAVSSKNVKNGELELPTIFDALKKTKKKALIISTLSNSFNDLFKGKSVDIMKTKSGAESLNTALRIIKEDIYDLVFVIDSDYDDCIRIGLPLSKGAKKVVEEQISRFNLLNDATDVYWKGDILLGFCPDKGCHRSLLTGRTCGISAPDMNVMHFYNIKNQ